MLITNLFHNIRTCNAYSTLNSTPTSNYKNNNLNSNTYSTSFYTNPHTSNLTPKYSFSLKKGKRFLDFMNDCIKSQKPNTSQIKNNSNNTYNLKAFKQTTPYTISARPLSSYRSTNSTAQLSINKFNNYLSTMNNESNKKYSRNTNNELEKDDHLGKISTKESL